MGGGDGCTYVGIDVGLGRVMAAQRSPMKFFTANTCRPFTTLLFGILRIEFCLLHFAFCKNYHTENEDIS